MLEAQVIQQSVMGMSEVSPLQDAASDSLIPSALNPEVPVVSSFAGRSCDESV